MRGRGAMPKLTKGMILEDDEIFGTAVEDTLAQEYNIVLCRSVEEAQSELCDDLGFILADLRLKEGTSKTFLKFAFDKYKTPTIVMTGNLDEEKMKDLEFASFIEKPFDPGEICS